MMRLQKFLAVCGLSSRRKAEDIIRDGRVSVNGTVIQKMGVIVDEEKDVVMLDGREIRPEAVKRYIVLNKPKGYITTASDRFERHTVMELVADIPERIYPVGRLDYDTEGLLLLTNDGAFANSMAHPRHKIEKVYIATVTGTFDEQRAGALRRGVEIDGRRTAPADIDILQTAPHRAKVRVVIREGRNRQVRKMFASVGCTVNELKRLSVGSFSLGNLPIGAWRTFTEKELAMVEAYKRGDRRV